MLQLRDIFEHNRALGLSHGLVHCEMASVVWLFVLFSPLYSHSGLGGLFESRLTLPKG